MAAFSFSQTNATFNNLNVRTQAKVRSNLFLVPTASPPAGAAKGMIYADTDGFVYYYDGSNWLSFSETSSNRNTLGWYSRKVASDLQFRGVKSTDGYIDFLDSTTYIGLILDTANLFNALPDQTETASNRNTEGFYSRKVAKNLQFRGIKSTNGYIDFLDSTTYLGFILDTANLFNAIPAYTSSNRNTIGVYSRTIGSDFQFKGIKSTNSFIDLLDSTTYIGFTLDTADLFNNIPQYWTFVDSATDTLKNNVATAGVVAIKGNLELQTTTSTVGQIKQNGTTIFHTFTGNATFPSIFIGEQSGNYSMTGYSNIGIGKYTLSNATGNDNNVAIGYQSQYYMRSDLNTAVGAYALRGSTTAANNTGYRHVAIGDNALLGMTSGLDDVGVGVAAGYSNTTGSNNTFIGGSSGYSTTTGGNNMAVGYQAFNSNTANTSSVAIGYQAMYYADNRTPTGRITYNTAVGYEAMRGSTTAANNTGQYNTAVGYQALNGITSGAFNTVYGYDAGGGITTGDSNIFIGTNAGATLTTESDRLVIDNTNTSTR